VYSARQLKELYKVRKSPLSIKKPLSGFIPTHTHRDRPNRAGLFVVSLVLLVSAGFLKPAYPQTTDRETTFRLAQGLEQAGEYERAVVLFRQLYSAEPLNLVYFDELQRSLMQLKRYDEVVALIRGRLQSVPQDVSLLAMLGSVYYRSGNESSATAVWDSALFYNSGNPNAYRIVASTLSENRLLEKSAEVYHRGRSALGDSSLFTIELSQLLSASMDYAGATTEYLRWLEKNPTQLAYVQGRMASFTAKKDARDAAAGVIRSSLRDHEDLTRLNLLAWLELEGKEFDAALEIERRIDRLSQARGTVLQKFADRAASERAYDIAVRAYEDAIETPLPADHLPWALYGRACAMKELGSIADTLAISVRDTPSTEAMPLYGGVISEFRKIIEAYPKSEFSAKSLYQIGRLQFEKFNDLDGAIASFRRVLDDLKTSLGARNVSAISFDVNLMLGRVHLTRGDTAKAAEWFNLIAASPDALPEQTDEALFHLAEIDYFGDHFDQASQKLEALTVNLKADFANDALRLRGFLTENLRTSPEALRRFAQADFLAHQHRNTEATTILLGLVEAYPQAPLVDDALLMVATLQAKAGLWHDAASTYERLLTQFKESSIALDRAQFQLAEVYQYGLKEIPKAIEVYEKLLADHPSSVLIDTARRRIRQLRGDTL
jgi:tetratricopeptide (TPR) repeat protein